MHLYMFTSRARLGGMSGCPLALAGEPGSLRAWQVLVCDGTKQGAQGYGTAREI